MDILPGRGITVWMMLTCPELVAAMPRPYAPIHSIQNSEFKIQNSPSYPSTLTPSYPSTLTPSYPSTLTPSYPSTLKTVGFQLVLQHFPLRLFEQQIIRLVLGKHVVQQRCTDLKLAGGFPRPGIALKHQSRHLGHPAKLTLGQFRNIQAGADVVLQIVQAEELAGEQVFVRVAFGAKISKP
jgi:hypothetical protein